MRAVGEVEGAVGDAGEQDQLFRVRQRPDRVGQLESSSDEAGLGAAPSRSRRCAPGPAAGRARRRTSRGPAGPPARLDHLRVAVGLQDDDTRRVVVDDVRRDADDLQPAVLVRRDRLLDVLGDDPAVAE